MDNILDYSSDSSAESDIGQVEESEESETTIGKKRPLPSIPEQLQDKFVKKPSLPHPEFYDMKIAFNPRYSNLIRAFPHIDIKPTTAHSNTIQHLLDEVKTIFKLSGLRMETNSLLYSNLSIPQNLHLSLYDQTYHTKQGVKLYESTLRKELAKCQRETRTIAFDKLAAVPNINRTHIFVVLSLSQQSADSIRPFFDLVERTAELASEGKLKLLTDQPLSKPNGLHVSIGRSFALDPKFDPTDAKCLQKVNDVLSAVEFDQSKIQFEYDRIKLFTEPNNIMTFPIGN